MKCTHCEEYNEKNSKFCNSCGKKLHEADTESTASHSSLLDGLDDIIFTPKRKDKSLWIFIICLVVAGFIFLGGIVIYTFSHLSITGGDQNYGQESKIDDPISWLSIDNLDSEWGGVSRNIFYLKGVLHNSSNKPIKNISVRIDFSIDEEGKEIFDTRYITLVGVADNGAYTFNEIVPGFYTEKKNWYTAKILSAEFVEE